MPKPRVKNRRPSRDRGKPIALCLAQAFPVGDAGSFTSLLQTIGENTE